MSLGFRISVETISNAVAALRTTVDEAKLHFSPDGFESRAVDPANVAMVDVSILNSDDDFERLETDGEEITLGVNLESFADVISMADSDDDLIGEVESGRLDMEFPQTGLSYNLALIDPDSIRQEPDLPDLGDSLKGTYVIPGRVFDRGLKAADLVGDTISIHGESDAAMAFTAEGDTDDVRFVVGEGGDDDLLSGTLDGDEAVESIFSLTYLEDMLSPVGKDAAVSMRLGAEFPIKFRYSFESTDVQCMVAPRIEGS
jgi:proliferating cell nuclear antigen